MKKLDKKVISSITIGIAAALAMMGPVTAYADTVEGSGEGGNNGNNEQQNNNQSSGIADAAISVANDLEAATVDNGSYDVQTTYNDAVDSIIAGESNLDTENLQTPLKTDSEALLDAAKAAKDVETETQTGELDENGDPVVGKTPLFTPNEAPAEAVDAKTMADEVKSIKTDLENVNDADKKADESAKETLESYAGAAFCADVANKAVEAANDQIRQDNIIDRIENATSAEDALAAYNELNKITNDTADIVALQRQAFDAMNTQYEKAKEELRKQDKRFNDNLGVAGADLNALKNDLNAAQEQVDNLKKAVDTVEDDLLEKESFSDYKYKTFSNANWQEQRAAMISVATLYINEVLGIKDATVTLPNVDDKISGFDTQDGNRVPVTYTDSTGSHTIYLNYNRANRTIDETDQWKDINKGCSSIVVFEKSELEVAADDYIKAYYLNKGAYKGQPANNPTLTNQNASNLKGISDYKGKVNAGDFDVFAFIDANGNRVFKVKEEIDAGVADGSILYDANVGYVLDGVVGTKVKQTTLANVDNLKTLTVSNSDLYKNIPASSEDHARYADYEKKIDAAASEIKEAKGKAVALQNAIDKIDRKDNRLGAMVNDIIPRADATPAPEARTYTVKDIIFELSPALNADQIGMLQSCETLEEAIELLDGWMKKLEGDIERAESNLKELTQMRDEYSSQFPSGTFDDNDYVESGDQGGSSDTAGGSNLVANAGGNQNVDAAAGNGIQEGVLGAHRKINNAKRGPAIDQITKSADTGVLGAYKVVNKPVEKNSKIKEHKLTTVAGTLGKDGIDAGMSWWWIIVVLVLGEAGRELYLKWKEKKEGASIED